MTLELSRADVAGVLENTGIPAGSLFLGDAYYALPTEAWIQGPFARQFESTLEQMGFVYRTEKRDCENFAQWAAAWANYFHSETPDSPEAGLAFGELWIASLEHAINVALHRSDDGKIYVTAYEPQLNERGWSFRTKELNQSDWQSVWLCKI